MKGNIPKVTVEPLPKKPAEERKAKEYDADAYQNYLNEIEAYKAAKAKRANDEKLFRQQKERAETFGKRVQEKEEELTAAKESRKAHKAAVAKETEQTAAAYKAKTGKEYNDYLKEQWNEELKRLHEQGEETKKTWEKVNEEAEARK